MSENWAKGSDVIYERFAAGIDDAISNGEELKCADRDLQYGIKLQNERLKKHGLKLKYKLTPRGSFTEGLSLGAKWNDGHYVNRLEARTCTKDEAYYQGDKILFRKNQKATLYQTVTDTTAPNDIAGDEYVCPDCGAVSRVGELLQGCPSCGNQFKMSELYPKVSNYYFNPDLGRTEGELAGLAVPTIIITTAVVYSPMLELAQLSAISSQFTKASNPYQSMQSTGTALGLLIWGLILALFAGPIAGWIITAIIYMVRLGSFAAERIPMAKYLGCQREFENFMKQYSPEFSYEFFAGKAVSYVKMMIFSEDATMLPFYNGPAIDPGFKNVIDVSSMGAVGITKMETVAEYAVIHADVHVEDTYYLNGKITRVHDVLKVVMRKNVTRPVDMRFKITSIHCPTCGGSFDATKNKICPYCSNVYRMEDIDWSVEMLGR